MITSRKRWIVRYESGQPSAQEVDDLVKTLKKYSLRIVDDSLPKMALVTGSKDDMSAMKDDLAEGWVVGAHTTYSVPDTKKKVKK